ncbi:MULTISPECIES: peptide chain release factor 3 [Clavibacter]|uniref:Peptide chain release factor 3 n=1 Tax=Clavibacter tessellarius TaxID=31965 RepID=A0A154V2U8_9MICO|nr:peptide chain release factor 3 [Clavibacter michiganensis]KZC95700.1 peptide chain release factor 3 [Clavibacter michiganensis subsp. tessellarius]
MSTITPPRAPASASASPVLREASRRRTFAVISHPDAGKSTLTEALLLHAHAIGSAGAVHGKQGRRSTVSDWMDMEKERGISVSSAAIQFTHRDTVMNVVDTPGHADFSEDTYRVLSAVDAAIMLVDASRGLETQTMKLFEVCRQRRIPIITVINKWDRPGREPLDLMDEIKERTGLLPTPLTWPVGESGAFFGVVDRSTGECVHFTRTAGGASIAPETRMSPEEALAAAGSAWTDAVEESELLHEEGQDHDEESFLARRTTPVLFAAAVLNFGVTHILDALDAIAPAAQPRPDEKDRTRPVEEDFSGFVFKVQSGMNTAHRDRLAFMRICSGVFHRGMTVTHAQTGRPFVTKYAQQLFGRERSTVDDAYPGDVVGLVNASNIRVGDTLFDGAPVTFPRLPQFAPELFRVVRSKDTSTHKQFRKGIEQLDHEGVIQVMRSDLRGDQAPVLGAVGPMQFEVVVERMTNEFRAPLRMEPLEYQVARITDAASAPALAKTIGVEVLVRSDGTHIALITTPWRLKAIERDSPELTLVDAATALPDA